MGNVRGTQNRRIGVSDDDALCQSVSQSMDGDDFNVCSLISSRSSLPLSKVSFFELHRGVYFLS